MPIFGFISIIITSKSLIRISLCYLCKCVCVVRGNGIWWLSSMFVSFANGMERKCGKSCLWIKMRKSNGTYGREGGININPIICQKKKWIWFFSLRLRFVSFHIKASHIHTSYNMIWYSHMQSALALNVTVISSLSKICIHRPFLFFSFFLLSTGTPA